MSTAHSSRAGASGTRRRPPSALAQASGRETGTRERNAASVAALVQLFEMDRRSDPARPSSAYERAAGREALVAALSRDLEEAYERVSLAGRQPAVVPLLSGSCSGCHVRLPTTSEQTIRSLRGVAACPRCLRLVYDPGLLDP